MRAELAGRRSWAARTSIAALALVVVVAACAQSSDTAAPVVGCADVIDAEIVAAGTFYRVSATVSSPDTGWEKYADQWVVRTPAGTVLGTRELAHPHVDEQPFTRTLAEVSVPEGEAVVEIAARDSVEGFCGEVVILGVPGL